MMRYYSLSTFFQEIFHEKVYKLALNGGMSCPNRDGSIGTGGCLFCSEGGSGDFAEPVFHIGPKGTPEPLSEEELLIRLAAAKSRLKDKKVGRKFIAYFQAFTNTYAPVSYLRRLFFPVLMQEDIAGLSIGTRPDCLPEEVLSLLQEMNQIKPVFVELGLQTIHEKTAAFLKRGYELPCFDQAIKCLQSRNLPVVVHLILGLPGEGKEELLASVRYLNEKHVHGVKFQLLHILKGTALADWYLSLPANASFHALSKEEYLDLLCDAIATLSPDIVIHRLTGDGPKQLLLAPLFSADKKDVLNSLQKELILRNIIQGCSSFSTSASGEFLHNLSS